MMFCDINEAYDTPLQKQMDRATREGRKYRDTAEKHEYPAVYNAQGDVSPFEMLGGALGDGTSKKNIMSGGTSVESIRNKIQSDIPTIDDPYQEDNYNQITSLGSYTGDVDYEDPSRIGSISYDEETKPSYSRDEITYKTEKHPKKTTVHEENMDYYMKHEDAYQHVRECDFCRKKLIKLGLMKETSWEGKLLKSGYHWLIVVGVIILVLDLLLRLGRKFY
jgi:hypothetical protein